MNKKIEFIFALLFCSVLLCFSACKFKADTTNPADTTKPGTDSNPANTDSSEVPAPAFRERTVEKIENVEPVIQVDSVYYEYESDGVTLKTGTTVSTGDYNDEKILTVTAVGNGLLIKKYNDPAWWYTSIKIKNATENIDVAYIKVPETESKSGKANYYFYPFTKAGDKYELLIEKQEENYLNWGQTDKVRITAIGGDGNFYMNFDKFYFNHSTSDLIFKNLTIAKPESVDLSGAIAGGIYDGGSWTGNNIWPWGYSFDKSCINLGSGIIADKTVNENGFLKGKDILWVVLECKVWKDLEIVSGGSTKTINTEIVCPVISKTIYDAEEEKNSSRTILLTGKKKIPTVKISTSAGWDDGATHHFNKDWCNAKIEILNGDGSTNLSSTDVLIRDRGNSTAWVGKTPFALKFDSKQKLLGMPKDKRWVLMANYFDRTLIRNRFIGTLGNEIFNTCWNAQFTPVNVYMNDRFIGTYDLGEQIKISSKRVDVQNLEDYVLGDSGFNVDSNKDGIVDINDAGFILEIDCRNKQKYHFYSEKYYLPMNLKDPDFDSDTKVYSEAKVNEAMSYVKGVIDEFETMLEGKDFATKYADYIDVNSFVDWYIVNEFAKNFDSLFQTSVYVYYDPAAGKLKMGPNWDFDLGVGNCNGAEDTNGKGAQNPTGWFIHGGKKGIGSDNDELSAKYTEMYGSPHYRAFWINRLFEAPSFKAAVKNRWNETRVSFKNAINKNIVDYANEVYDYIPMNEANLPRLGKESWNGPDGYEGRTEYEDEVFYLYNWCMKRFEWMDGEISKW